MAAPSPRRPGYSRKAQYGLFAAYVIAVAGAVAGLLLVLISAFDPTGFAALRGIASEITAPVSRTSSSVVGSIGSADENGMNGSIFGKVADQVAEKAPCSVQVVRRHPGCDTR